MKAVSFFLLSFLALAPVFGQGNLPLNENGKVMFYEVVNADVLSKEVLYTKAISWLSDQSLAWQDESKGDSSSYRLTTTSSFPVYAKGYVSKQLHGTISYRLTLELKDYRYRFYVTDFVFHYHQMDRNYKMVPTGRTKPLEDQKAQGWQKTWESHQAATHRAMTDLANELKATLKNKVPTEEKVVKQVSITEKW